jgi:hypothetical protein
MRKHHRKLDQLNAGTQFWRSPHIAGSRRMFFRHVTAGLGGYFLLPMVATETVARAAVRTQGTAKQVIFIMMAGAPSHVDTFDLKEGSWTPASFDPTSYADKIRFPRGLMPKLAEHLPSLAFLRSVRSWAVVHGLANQWIQVARNPISSQGRVAPHIGSVVAREFGLKAQAALPAFFSLNAFTGPGSGFLSSDTSPVFLQPNGAGLSPETSFMDRAAYARRRELLMRLEEGQQYEGSAAEAAQFKLSAREILFSDRIDRLFKYEPVESQRYGRSAFGNACLVARNLVSAAMGVRYVEITIPGWDMHSGIYRALPNLGGEFDQGLGALISDLKANGKFDETLIVAMGEFGRTVGDLNGLQGRDHFPQQSVLLAGGGVRGLRAIGETDAKGSLTSEPGWSADRHIRAEDIAATIYSALGIDWTTVIRTESGSRFEYVPVSEETPYQAVSELWS